MSTFAVFTYRFEPMLVQADLFQDPLEHPEERMNKKQEYFARFFDGERIELKYNNKVYESKVLFNENGIIALCIANKHRRRIEKNFEKDHIDDYPSLIVLIDNRKDCQHILIEKRAIAFNDERTVYHILQKNLEVFMNRFGLRIIISQCYDSQEFWTLIKEIQRGKGISAIRFNIYYPNLADIRIKASEGLSNMAKEIGAKKAEITLEANPNEVLNVEENKEDIVDMAEASAACGSPIKIREKGQLPFRVTGTSKRYVSWENFNIEVFKGDIFNQGYELLAEFLNRLKRH